MGSRARQFGCLVVLAAWAWFQPTAAATDFVTVRGTDFYVCNQPLRFVGHNVRGICHYGRGDALPDSQYADIATNLDYCASAGARVIRVFCSYRFIGQTATGDRLQTILDACAARGIYVMVAFTDMYDGPNFFPQGDIAYFTNGLLNHSFFAGGYETNYLPQVLYLVNRFKGHPAVFCWQLGNEIRDIGYPATTMAFMQDMAGRIRAIDSNHLLSTGFIGWQNAQLTLAQAHTLYAAFDFVNSHNYNGADTQDYALAADMGKPYVVDEAGWDCTEYGYHRTGLADAEITKWVNRGARGYLQWGLMATSYNNGDGDEIFGVDRQNHWADFEEYRVLFSRWAANLVPPVTPGLTVEPSLLSFNLNAGLYSTASCTVTAVGAQRIAFVVTSTAWPAWLQAAPLSGIAGCAPALLSVTCRTDGLSPGTYTTQFQVTAADPPSIPPATVEVTLTVAGKPADFDGDNDVDQEDYAHLQTCLDAPGHPVADPACANCRLDSDDDVDQNDVTIFQRCLSGPGVMSDVHCAD